MAHPLEVRSQFRAAQSRFLHRDTRNAQVQMIRKGRLSDVAPSLFPAAGPWQEPIIANLIDVAARDMAEMIAPLPSFNCSSPSMHTDAARRRATKRTKIALGISTHSNLQVQMYSGADTYVTYGSLPIKVELDYDNSMPFIKVMSPLNFYPVYDRWNRLSCYFQRALIPKQSLMAQYPEHRADIEKMADGLIEVVFHHDKDTDSAYVFQSTYPMTLSQVRNPMGRVMVTVAQRPGATDVPRGQFDDVIFVQLARHRFAMLGLEAATEAIHAPIVLPDDVQEIPLGPGATITTRNPQGVGRLMLDVPRDAFTEGQLRERELQQGARFPSVRTGNSDASIVTGKGVQSLLGGYDSQVKAHQAILAAAFQEVMSLAMEADEKVFGGKKKTLRGAVSGTPYEIEYDPAADIRGDYSVDVQYGLMAGLDPNRWLVFGLQARAEKLFSRDFLRREMPVDIDADEEARKVDLEDLEETAKQAVQGYAQAIPALASQGADPAGPIQALAKVIELRRKGTSISDAVVEAFTPKPPPEA